MTKLESEARRRRRIGHMQKAVLGTLAVAGILSVGLLAPNIFQIFGRRGLKKLRFDERLRGVTSRLVDEGLIEFVQENGRKSLRITEKGEQVLAEHEFVPPKKKQKRWDKRWRLVIFDIAESRRFLRERLRRALINFGFVKVQNSVWVYPYDCEDLITLLKADMRIGKEILYAIVERIENDVWLREHFDLPAPD